MIDLFRRSWTFVAALAIVAAVSLPAYSQYGAAPPALPQYTPMPAAFPSAEPRIAAANPVPAAAAVPANPAAEAETETAEAPIPTQNLFQVFRDGGWMMYPIALCSFIVMVFTMERLLYLRGGRVIPKPFVSRLIELLQQQQIDRDEAIELCEKNPSPIAEIILTALRRYGRPAVDLEAAVMDAGERVNNTLRRNLRLLSAISNVAPLLGLLGTVLGMIQAFNEIAGAGAMGRPESLAGGISTALLTTAGGLFVAIPAYLAYMYFSGRVDRLMLLMDQYAQQVIEAASAEGLAEADSSRTRSRKRAA